MARRAEESHLSSAVVPIEEDEPPDMTFSEWLDLCRTDGPVDLGISASELLREAREAGEV